MDSMTKKRIEQLREAKKNASMGGGESKLKAQRAKGKLTARERIDYLLDAGSFEEFGILLGNAHGAPGDGLISGHGTIDGRPVCLYCQDPTVKGGSIGALHGYKMYKTVERAFEMGVPFIGLHDSPGARLPQIAESKTAIGDLMEKSGASIFYPNTKASGVVPQISGILGSCAGISVYSPALTDFIFMVEHQSHMYITGPTMVKSVMGSEITHDELGGVAVHCKISGVADRAFPDEKSCLFAIRELLGYLPSNAENCPPRVDPIEASLPGTQDLCELVPAEPSKPYDMLAVIKSIVDGGRFFEIKPDFARELIIGFGRLNGQSVGIVANQPKHRAGCLTTDSSDKQARFIRFCDCFNIPLVLLVDTPAYMPGKVQEHAGIIRHGAKVLYALCEATVPRVAVVLRKCYGGGNLGMGVLPGLGTDMVFYWPIVEIGVLGAVASVELYFGKEIATAPDPDSLRAKKLEEYKAKYSNPIREASANWGMEDVIEPNATRQILIKSLNFLSSKKRTPICNKRHGNMPL
jgi:acetyl-CoA carboxylase carboxyltransferase component